MDSNNCIHELEELESYYFDSWHFRSSVFFETNEGKRKVLCYCKKCGQLFVEDKEKNL